MIRLRENKINTANTGQHPGSVKSHHGKLVQSISDSSQQIQVEIVTQQQKCHPNMAM